MAGNSKKKIVAMAAAAHPDDIEFMMAGTLLLLKEAGAEIHMWNLADGGRGTNVYSEEEIVRIRAKEAQNSAKVAGAKWHPPVGRDMDLYFEREQLARAAAIFRQVKPDIFLVPSPQDYMEDHQNASRLTVTAAFARGMKNFITDPPVEPWGGDTVLYHSIPHTLRDIYRRRIRAEFYVDIMPVQAKKREMLAQHLSQKEWLDVSQGFDSYLKTSEAIDREVGNLSGRYEMAEGWRRRLHIGFGPEGWDPLGELLAGKICIDEVYKKTLE